MHVACCTDGYAQVLTKFYNKAVYILYILRCVYPVIRRLFGGEHKFVVSVRLDLQIVIKACYLLDLIIVSALEISLNDLATLAGTTEDKTLTVSYKLRFWYSRTSFEIFKIGI